MPNIGLLAQEIEKEINQNGIEKFYQSKILNRIGKNQEYSEAIAEELLKQNIVDKISTIDKITRDKGYKVETHDGNVTKGKSIDETNRIEERFAIELFNQSKDGKVFNHLGKIIDYQVPLKNKQTDEAGKIDLISKTEEAIYLIELKTKNSKETLLRCTLEIATYYQILSKTKFIESYKNEFENLNESNIKKAILIVKDSQQHNELRTINNVNKKNLKKLMSELEIHIFVIDKESFEVTCN